MTTFEKFKLRMKVWLGGTPPLLQPVVRAALWTAWKLGAVKREKYVYAKLGFPSFVHAGPFTGMRYLPVSCGSALLPKIAGSYEKELHSIIEQLKSEGIDEVIDVGSAEGYYAIGLTRLLRPERTHCFDIDESAHPTMLHLARLNGVHRTMVTHGGCESAELDRLLAAARRPLLVMDCEGAEYMLLNLEKVPALARAIILVETHEWKSKLKPGEFEQQFASTHTIKRLETVTRTAADCPYRDNLTEQEQVMVVDEIRLHRQHWLYLRPIGK